ncbi:MAG: 50S ribosomal protein L29 [Proteobacteria bacterium]|nr:MAG: 50S ribosomal protein L29 [Pseudomonadota bacterium]PIE17855.1 MAG: 50S ribosomal protein L29 [Pseudomonadota bacterium]
MKMIEIRERTDEELRTLESQLQEDLYRMRVQKATNQLENTATLKTLKRDLARVKTIQAAREKGVEESRKATR